MNPPAKRSRTRPQKRRFCSCPSLAIGLLFGLTGLLLPGCGESQPASETVFVVPDTGSPDEGVPDFADAGTPLEPEDTSAEKPPGVMPVFVKKQLEASNFDAQPMAVAYANDRKPWLAAGYNTHEIILWDPQEGTELQVMKGHTDFVEDLLFTPNNRFLYSAGWDGALIKWDPESGDLVRKWDSYHPGKIYTLAYSPQHNLLVTGGEDQTVLLLGTQTERSLGSLQGFGGHIADLAFHPSGKWLAVGSGDGVVTLWEFPKESKPRDGKFADSLKKIATINETQDESTHIESVAFSPDGRWLAFSNWNSNIYVWDLETSSMRTVLTGHTTIPFDLVFSHDSRHLISCDRNDGQLYLWKVNPFRKQNAFQFGDRSAFLVPSFRRMVLDSNGSELAISGGFWDVILCDVDRMMEIAYGEDSEG
ncbi:Hypothetical protein PBC10988_21620 [Planctomycetales bacterium 10988]|nr:Hypothetical protein PBC10988_21620 [Planctomycetales bacterium 10988]